VPLHGEQGAGTPKIAWIYTTVDMAVESHIHSVVQPREQKLLKRIQETIWSHFTRPACLSYNCTYGARYRVSTVNPNKEKCMSVQSTVNNDRFSMVPWNQKGMCSRARYHGDYHHSRVYKHKLRQRGSTSETMAWYLNFQTDTFIIQDYYGKSTTY